MSIEDMAKQAVDFLQVENFQMDQVLEYKLAKQQGK